MLYNNIWSIYHCCIYHPRTELGGSNPQNLWFESLHNINQLRYEQPGDEVLKELRDLFAVCPAGLATSCALSTWGMKGLICKTCIVLNNPWGMYMNLKHGTWVQPNGRCYQTPSTAIVGDCQEMDMGLVSAIDAGKLLETQVVTRYSQAISMYVNLVHLYCSIQNVHKEHM